MITSYKVSFNNIWSHNSPEFYSLEALWRWVDTWKDYVKSEGGIKKIIKITEEEIPFVPEDGYKLNDQSIC